MYGRDHPRIRGVHEDVLKNIMRDAGSSPHTRGTRTMCHGLSLLARIIPAYAGYTSSPTDPPDRTKDHPRIRGVHRVKLMEEK